MALAVGLTAALLGVPDPAGAGGQDAVPTAARHSQGPDDPVTRRDETGLAVAVRPDTPIPAPAAVAGAAARVRHSTGAAVAVAQAQLAPFAKQFGADPTELVPVRTHLGVRGETVALGQRIEGRPVFGAEVAVWLTGSGAMRSALGRFSADHFGEFPDPGSGARARGARSAGDVVDRQLHRLYGVSPGAASLDVALAGERWFDPAVFDLSPLGLAIPAYLYDVTAGSLVHWQVLVHAPTGEPLAAFDANPSLDRAVCDANSSVPSDTGTGVRCGDEQPFKVTRGEGAAPTGIADVDDAYTYFGDTSAFYAQLGVDLTDLVGVDYGDGRGKAVRGTVRICQALQCPYPNAFWNGEQMAFGEGLVTDDVAAHELSHGVTERLAPLTYLYQAGAINEAMSDIFGELVDLGNGSPDDTSAARWLIGEGSTLGPIRSMADPPAYGDPDRMQSGLWSEDRFMLDSGGVHTNSGVGNKAAYLIVDGGTFHGQTVAGLGLTKGAQLFETARQILPTGADYAILAEALRASCQSTFTSADCAEVGKALQATEMDLPPASSPVRAPVCDAGATVAVSTSSDFSTATGFTLDARSWKIDTGGSDFSYSRDGTGSAFGVLRTAGAYSMSTKGSLRVPTSGHAYLRMTHAYALTTSALRAGSVSMEMSVDGGSTWSSMATLPWVNGPTDATKQAWTGTSGGWQTSRVDLASLAGSKVRFRWTTRPSGVVPGGWWIDDVRIYTCS